MTMYACKDCKHSKISLKDKIILFTLSGYPSYAYRCTLPESWVEPEVDAVTGPSGKGHYNFCSTIRGYGSEGDACGPEATNWVPKDTKKIFLFLKKE